MNIGIIKEYVSDQEEVNELNILAKEHQVTIFCNYHEKNIDANFAYMQLIEAFHFKGYLFTDELECLLQCKKCLLKKDLYYYCRKIDWQKDVNLQFQFMQKTLLDEKLNILIKNDKDQEIITKLTGKTPKLLSDWSRLGEIL